MNSQNDKSLLKMGNLDWSSENRLDSIQAIYGFVTTMAEEQVEWYKSKKKSVRFLAKTFRISAILITTVAALVPMLSNIIIINKKPLDPVWASVALAIAAALIAMDRFFGYSASWMRFITSEIKIDALLQDFQLDWEIERSALEGEIPSTETMRKLLQKCRTFLKSVNDVLIEESEQWKNDFRNAIIQIDKSSTPSGK